MSNTGAVRQLRGVRKTECETVCCLVGKPGADAATATTAPIALLQWECDTLITPRVHTYMHTNTSVISVSDAS